ncbi:hypothetical protein [Sutcliffiella horikoshii]|nr:hypothetical protein [Sutcliffiella horikoshii]
MNEVTLLIEVEGAPRRLTDRPQASEAPGTEQRYYMLSSLLNKQLR